MPTSAQALIKAAPIGALITFSDGRPRPPARFRRKLSAWRRRNGVGRLDRIIPAERLGSIEMPDQFLLHVGDFGSTDVRVLSVRLCFDARSPLTFSVVDAKPGCVIGFVTDGVRLELGGVFSDEPAALRWLRDVVGDRAFLAEVRPGGRLQRLRPILIDVPAHGG